MEFDFEKTKERLMSKNEFSFDDLLDVMRLLRSENGCPWDREQTHASIRNNLLEEAYEAVEGIDKNDPGIMREELGDLLLQVVFHAQIASESGEFSINDVTTEICRKLIVRHPHIFADTKVSGSGEVLTNWDKIKYETKGLSDTRSVMEGVSRALPSLVRAQKLQKRGEKAAKNIGKEKYNDVRAETEAEKIAGEIFALAEKARKLGIDAEEALEKYNDKFIEANA